jgi:inosose dehydratase
MTRNFTLAWSSPPLLPSLPAVFAALKGVNYRGWAVVELDRVPEKSTTPKQAAVISKRYLEEKIGVTV